MGYAGCADVSTRASHAVSYGLCEAPTPLGCDSTPDKCGFQQDHNVTIWRSPDLVNWTYVGLALEWTARLPGVLFRPSVVWNPHTRLFVLWVNLDRGNGTHGYHTFTAPTVSGRFVQVSSMNNVTNGSKGVMLV